MAANFQPEDEEYKRILMQNLQRLEQPTPEVGPSNNQLIAGLAQSASQIGTLGGKQVSTEPIQRYATMLDQAKAARAQQDMAKTAQQSKILEALAQLKDKSSARQNQLSIEQSRLDQARQDRLAQQDFQRSQQDRLFAQQRELQGEKMAAAMTKATKPTEGQQTAGYHANRMLAANDMLDQISKSGYDPATYGASLRKTNLPFVGQAAANPQDRAYDQAAREFIASVLRKETGASVTPEEFATYSKIYLPAPGDDKQVLAQKADARKRATENMIQVAGSAYDPAKQNKFVYEAPAEEGTAQAATPKSPEAPKTGDILDGYRFKGGNPADPNAWEEVQ